MNNISSKVGKGVRVSLLTPYIYRSNWLFDRIPYSIFSTYIYIRIITSDLFPSRIL